MASEISESVAGNKELLIKQAVEKVRIFLGLVLPAEADV
jgi:hypothetical protein